MAPTPEPDVYEVTIRGTRPLLMHRYVHEDGAARAKRGTIPSPEEEAEKALYRKADGTIFEPSSHIEGALVQAAKEFKMTGRRTYRDVVRASVLVEPLEIPLKDQTFEIDQRSAVVQRARILRARPRFGSGWELTFKLIVQDKRLGGPQLKGILEEAGRSVGVGDFRPKFGLFEIVRFEPSSPSTSDGRG